MFYNAGKKIQTVAKTLFWLMVIINTIGAIMIGKAIGEGIGPVLAILVSIIIIAFGIFVAWLSVILLYSYGELCENVMSIEDDTGKINRKLDQMMSSTGGKSGSTASPGVTMKPATAPKQTGKQFDPDAYPAGPM